jgi:hypothetical protein
MPERRLATQYRWGQTIVRLAVGLHKCTIPSARGTGRTLPETDCHTLQLRPGRERDTCSVEQGGCWGGAGCREGGCLGRDPGEEILRFRCGDPGGASVKENRLAMWFRGCFPTRETLAGRASSAKSVNLVRNAPVAGGKTGQMPSNRTKTGGQPVRHENCGSKNSDGSVSCPSVNLYTSRSLCCFSFSGAVP